MYKDIICLANSKKNNARCIAGIEYKTGKWIRPVNPGGREVYLYQIKYSNGRIPELLDIIRITLNEHEPLYYQPENYIIGRGKWEKRGTLHFGEISQFCESRNHILFDTSDYLVKSKINNIPNDELYSLTLIKPENLRFEKIDKRPFKNAFQIKALFTYNNEVYRLTVTDDSFEERFNNLSFGIHRFNFNSVYLTISLASPFKRNIS